MLGVRGSLKKKEWRGIDKPYFSIKSEARGKEVHEQVENFAIKSLGT